MNRILIAEDETRIASFVEKGLRANGFITSVVGDGEEALVRGLSGEFDLMILDLGLPKRDGFSVLEEMREGGSTLPVVILTAQDGVPPTVRALDSGADDYVTKPFSFDELLARVRARLRSTPEPEQTVLESGALRLDLRTRCVHDGEDVVELTAREFTMAEVFFRHAGQVLSRSQLLSHVWGYDYEPDSNVVDVYVGYLRRKLGAERIATVRGMGYRLVD